MATIGVQSTTVGVGRRGRKRQSQNSKVSNHSASPEIQTDNHAAQLPHY